MLRVENTISEVYIGSDGPCGNKKKAEIFNFPQINVCLQVIPDSQRTELIGPAGTQCTLPEMESRFSFTHHQSLQPEAAGQFQLTVCLSIHLFLGCLNVSPCFFLPNGCFSLCWICLCCFRKKSHVWNQRITWPSSWPPDELLDWQVLVMSVKDWDAPK